MYKTWLGHSVNLKFSFLNFVQSRGTRRNFVTPATFHTQTLAAMQPMKRLLTILTLTIICSQVLGQTTDAKYRDKSVNEIRLRDPETVEKVLGKGKNYVDQDDDETEVGNSDGQQLLTMIFYPGGTTNDFYAFRVEYNTKDLKPNLKIQTKDFVTGKKI